MFYNEIKEACQDEFGKAWDWTTNHPKRNLELLDVLQNFNNSRRAEKEILGNNENSPGLSEQDKEDISMVLDMVFEVIRDMDVEKLQKKLKERLANPSGRRVRPIYDPESIG